MFHTNFLLQLRISYLTVRSQVRLYLCSVYVKTVIPSLCVAAVQRSKVRVE